MHDFAFWLTSTAGQITLMGTSAVLLGTSAILLLLGLGSLRGATGPFKGYLAFFAGVIGLTSAYLGNSWIVDVPASAQLLSKSSACEREMLLASGDHGSPISVSQVRKAQRHCQRVAESAPERQAAERLRAEQNAVLSTPAD
jgi:hypothetical protein